ncbi:hypothetical protein S7711_07493 [Stachybotrys chartarum IBT 7711]|uniref:FAD-binding domain-containing protein n=1 Tax=Stachybotrys chartarum (strain CBS 109288 / IBT 7711) TaxID=1280523 RepID=A0A084B7D8_STACB|nr:hypothetical protein S7711_07493 [Stachybotrys chartarum IBT 7711]
MATKDLKVIIAGGGVAGLTLANMLEQFGVDYLVLEAHSHIAPPVGASIGLFPNGLRILDEMGCYDEIKRMEEVRTRGPTNTRNESGKVIKTLVDMPGTLEIRHGYGLIFFERQRLLQILYGQLRHKERVLTDKKVTDVDLVDGGVAVKTADGDAFTGTFLVGADGVHSAARKLMVELGQKLQPGYFTGKEASQVACHYKCSFGIAKDVPGWNDGEQTFVIGKGSSQLIASGPNNQVYWFFFVRLPKVKYGDDIPRYTKEDEAEMVKQYSAVRITEKVNFGQIYARRVASTLTPLHEIVHKKWFFGRIIALGDSVHKPNPIGGQGGNGALESCAELVNALMRMKQKRGGSLAGLQDTEIQDIFSQTQRARHQRAKMVLDLSHQYQAINAYESPLLSLIFHHVVGPLASDESSHALFADMFCRGSSLAFAPKPHRPHVIPFENELPAKPVPKTVSRVVLSGFIGLMLLAIMTAHAAFQLVDVSLTWGETVPIVIQWLGEGSQVSEWLNRAVSIFSEPLLSEDPAPRVQLAFFLSQLISPILISTIDGYRAGNGVTLLGLPIVSNTLMSIFGRGQVVPAQAILSAVSNATLPTGRIVPTEVARALIPAITFGYIIPTALLFALNVDNSSWQNWVALWQFAPPAVNVVTYLLSSLQRQRKPRAEHHGQGYQGYPPDFYDRRELPALKYVYTFAFAVQAAAHISTLIYCWTHPSMTIVGTLFGLERLTTGTWRLKSFSSNIAAFVTYDMAISMAAIVGSNLYTVWGLRSTGYITTQTTIKGILSVVAGQFLVGSGATWAGLVYWQEEVIADLSKKTKEGIPKSEQRQKLE